MSLTGLEDEQRVFWQITFLAVSVLWHIGTTPGRYNVDKTLSLVACPRFLKKLDHAFGRIDSEMRSGSDKYANTFVNWFCYARLWMCLKRIWKGQGQNDITMSDCNREWWWRRKNMPSFINRDVESRKK